MARSLLAAFALTSALAACSGPQAAPPEGAPTGASPLASSAPPASAPAPTSPGAAAPSASVALTGVAPAASAPAASAPAASASAAGSASTAELGPMPKVKVENIGMHIGGGPNDAETKAPIHRSVEPHFDELRRCFARAEDPKKGGTFGVDLMIEKDGGKADVSKPRTSLEGKSFKDCVVGVFEAIDFQKPRKGKTKVSYSIRFTP